MNEYSICIHYMSLFDFNTPIFLFPFFLLHVFVCVVVVVVEFFIGLVRTEKHKTKSKIKK